MLAKHKLYRDNNFPVSGFILVVPDSGSIKHLFGSDHSVCGGIFITIIYYGFDPALYYSLGTLVAGEQRNIELGALKTPSSVIENGI